MQVKLTSIPLRDTLHFLGWRGTPVEPELLERITALCDRVISDIRPNVVMRRFAMDDQYALIGSSFLPQGDDIRKMLAPCGGAVLLAATLGAESERMLLREQARSSESALLLDAVLSAAIESVCDVQENALRETLLKEGLYLTDRFSPGYGDMPIGQTREICSVLNTERTIGLTVSGSGIMMPRKSVTAVMGVGTQPVERRASGCETCSAREHCNMRRNEEPCHGTANHPA